MGDFKVIQVIRDGNPMPDWVPQELEKAGLELTVATSWDVAELARNASDADIVWSYGGRHGLLKGENLKVLKRCGAIVRTGSGTDNVDIRTCTELGILVANTPDAVTDPVVDHTISLLFSLVRQIAVQDRHLRAGRWEQFQVRPLRRFCGATLGLIGFGRIPRRIVSKLAGFEIKFLSFDPYVSAESMAAQGVKKVSLEELLRLSDYVSVNAPLNEDTRYLLDAQALRMMQPHAVLINTARGALVDEAALAEALKEKRIAGAALDVFEHEPIQPDNPLLGLDNVILTPHLSGYADSYPEDMCRHTVEAMIDLKEGYWPRSCVNPQVVPRWGPLKPRRHA